MRNCIYLLCLASLLAYSNSTLAHPHDRETKVAWACLSILPADRVLVEAYGERNVCGVREKDRSSYLAHRDNLTSSDYDNALVIYTVRDNRRHDHRETGHNLAIGIAHHFSEYRLSEVTIEQFEQSRSRVVDVDDIRGVVLFHIGSYGKSFTESALHHLGEEWQQRFPTANGQVYKFMGGVLAGFSDNTVLFEVREVSREAKEPTPLHDRPLVLIDKRYLLD